METKNVVAVNIPVATLIRIVWLLSQSALAVMGANKALAKDIRTLIQCLHDDFLLPEEDEVE
jgi:hypothetical protein